MSLPPAREAPCFDCPWRRASAKGWLGPYTAEKWQELAHSDVAIACHITIPEGSEFGDWDDDGLLQCAGVAIYRTNVAKSPRHPEVATLPRDTETVFGFGEFVKHHTL